MSNRGPNSMPSQKKKADPTKPLSKPPTKRHDSGLTNDEHFKRYGSYKPLPENHPERINPPARKAQTDGK